MGAGEERRQRRAVTPSTEQISRATFSSRGSRQPDVAIIAKCYQVDLSFQPDDEKSYLFITFVLSLR